MPSAKQIQKQDAVQSLKELIKEGDILTFIITKVASSGMSRCMKVLAVVNDLDGKPYIRNITRYVAKATENTITKNDELRVSGCGMDMRFHVAEHLAHVMGFSKSFPYEGV
jgi:hypothetical protein